MSTVNSITVSDVSNISVTTVGTQGVAGPNTILGRSVADSTASTAGSLLVYDHGNTQWVDSQSTAAQSLTAKLYNLQFTSGGASVTGILDEDNMGSNSNTKLATQQSIKSYVDAQNAAQAINFQGDTGGNQSVTINSEVMNILGGTGLDSVGSDDTITFNIDSTVTTLTGTQTLTNKTLTSPVINTGDINNPDIDGGSLVGAAIDNSVIGANTAVAITGTVITATSFVIGSATITEAELEILDGATLSTDEINLLDGTTTGTVVASKALAVDSNKDITGFRNVTLTGELDAGSLDVSGDADIDGTLEADAITVNGTALAEVIQDTVGGMITSNTESGIAVTYEDSDGTLDFNVDDFTISLAGDLSGSVTITDLASASLTATIVNNAVALGTDTTGNYVATITQSNTGIDVANSGSETAAITLGLNTEHVQDLVGAMFSSNTESGIAVTYQDSDGTIDLDVDDFDITLSGDVAGSGTITNLGDVTISTTIQANSVALGTDTTGNYVATISAGEGIDVSGSGSESAGVTISAEDATDSNKGIASFDATDFTVSSGDVTVNAERIQDIVGAMLSSNTESGISLTYQDSDGTIDANVDDFTITLAGDLGGSVTVTDLASGTLTATIQANSVALGTDTTGNYVATIADSGDGTITVANSGSESAAVTLDVADDSIGNNHIKNNAVTLGTQSTGNYVATIAGTSNEITVSGSGSETAAVTISLPDDVTIGNDLTVTTDATVSQDLTVTRDIAVGRNAVITGDLTVNGTTTTINTANLDVEDTTIRFAKNASSLAATDGAGLEFGGSTSKPTILWNNTAGRLVSNKVFAATSFVGDVAGNATTATTLETARTIALSGDVVASATSFDGSGNITLSTTIQANSVALGTDTTGNYVATIAGTSNEIEVSGSGSETAAVTIGLPSSVDITTDLSVSNVDIATGSIVLKNSGTQSKIDFYCESSNAHYARLQAPAHSAFSGNVTSTLPTTTGNLIGTGDSGTVTNTMLAGSIANAKLSNSTVSFGGISLALGASDATPAFDLSDATNYPTSSLSGTITNAQLAGSIANNKLANSTITVGDGSNTTAIALGGSVTFSAGEGIDVTESSGTITIAGEDASSSNKGVASFDSTDFSVSSGAVTLQAERIQDIVGAMVSSNTESGIAVSYEDSDGTLDFNVNDPTITIDGDMSGSATMTNLGNTTITSTLDTVNSNVGSFGSSTAIPAITVNAKGLITAVSTNNISTSFTLSADSGSNDTFNTGDTLTIAGTSNEIETTVTNNQIQIGLPTAITVTTVNATNLNTTNLTIGSAAITEAELEILDGASVTTAELNILDGATITTTELNLLDGDTSATSTTLASADRVIVNDNGTMKQVALSDLAVYMGDNVTINQTQTALTVSGNGSFGGTLTVTGMTTLNGGLTMDTNKFTVADTSGNTSIGGTLAVTGASTLTGAVTASDTLAVTNDLTVNTNVLKVDTTNNRVGIKTASPSYSLDAGSATDAFFVPKGTTAQRPSGAAGLFRYNSTLGRFEGYTDAWGEIGGGGANTFTTDNFTTSDNSTTAFTLSQSPNSEDDLQVFVGGVFQNPNDYTLNGTTLTLDEAPPSGTRLVVYSVRSAVSGSNLNHDQFTASGSATFGLSIAPVSENNTMAFIDGVYQQKTDYSISGQNLVFDTAPTSGAIVEVMTFTQTDINVPVDDTISTAKLQSGAVTTAKIAADAITGAKIADDTIDSEHFAAASIDAEHLNANVISGLTEVTPVSGDKMMILDATDSALKKADVNDIMATAVSITSAADAVAMTFDSSENATFSSNVTANGTITSSGDLVVDTTKFVVDVSASSVGIGTASPSDEIHIRADNPAIRLDDTDGGYGRIAGINGAIYYQADEGANGASSFHRWDVAGTDNQMRLSTDGLALNSTATDGSRFYVKVPDSDTVSSALKLSQNNAAGDDRNTLSIKCDGPNNLAIFNSSGTNSGGYAFNSGGTERMRLSAAGRMVIGHNASISNGVASKLQVYHAGNEGSLSLGRWGAVTSPSYLTFMKSRGTNVGDNTIVNDNDVLGEIRWRAADGVNFNAEAGAIHCRVDGTPGADDMPGELHFQTTSVGSDSATSKMIIKPNGNVGIGTADAQTLLELSAHNAAGQNTLRFTDEDTGTVANQAIGKIEFYTKDGSGDGASVRAYILGAAQDASPSTYIAFATNSGGAGSGVDERMRIDKDGHVGIGTTSSNTELEINGANDDTHGQLRITSPSNGDAQVTFSTSTNGRGFYVDDSDTNRFKIYSGHGKGHTSGAYEFVLDNSGTVESKRTYNNTTGSYSANVYVHTDGSFNRATSSRRYKKDIVDAEKGLEEILKLKPRNYKPKNERSDKAGLNEEVNDPHLDAEDRIFAGLIAEEVHDLGLTEYVDYEEDGKTPSGLYYGNMVALLVKGIQELKAENDALSARIKTLEDK